MQANYEKNDSIKKRLYEEFHVENSTMQDVLKLKLWGKQDGICPYTLKSLDIERLFVVGYSEIDHIIPYSITFNDNYKNKVLVFANANRQKGNKIPL